MIKEKVNKICLIVDCLSKGGAEKIASRLSFAFGNKGYEVSILSVRNDITYKYSGRLYCIGENEPTIKLVKQIKKAWLIFKYYKKINANIYIDFRMRNRFFMEAFLHLFVFKKDKMIFRINNFNIHYHLPKSRIFYNLYDNSKAIVSIADDISNRLKKIYSFKNLTKIPNFYSKGILELSEEKLKINEEVFVLAVGRLLNSVKQFDNLIITYKETELYKKGIPFYILGEGPDKEVLELLIKENKLQENVKLLGFKSNPYKYIKNSKFLILSSKEEGFPNVVLESLAIGTPVVSFNCKSGPSEMIVDRENGLLVKDQDFEALKQAINLFEEDAQLYSYCKKNSQSSVKKFSQENVVNMWIDLFSN